MRRKAFLMIIELLIQFLPYPIAFFLCAAMLAICKSGNLSNFTYFPRKFLKYSHIKKITEPYLKIDTFSTISGINARKNA